MRIVHLSDCFLPMLGGIEMQVSQLAGRQSAAGHAVTVLTCAADTGDTDTTLPYRVVRSVWPNPFAAPVDPRAPRRFLRVIRATRPDVVHVHIGELTPVAQAVTWHLRDAGIPVVVTVHSVWSKAIGQPLLGLYGKAFANSPVVWTGVSELVAAKVAAAVGSDNTGVLPNGVDTGNWQITPREHPGLIVVTAARFAPRKRMQELLKITGEALRQSPADSLRAVYAGAGPGLNKARRWVRARGFEDQISLPGRLSSAELRELYEKADIFALASVKEAASIAAAEAQAAGLAILTRSQSGLGERISPFEGAAVDSDTAMTDTLVQWAKHPEQVQLIKEYNREHGCPLDWERVMPEVFGTYSWAEERARVYREHQKLG